MQYDVVVAGASFAGLAVAAQLRGKRVLLLDRKPVGAGQTSACGTLVSTLQALGLEDAIVQVHHRIVVHVPGRDFVYPVPEPFCTFDYRHLCQLLWRQTDADFIASPALGLAGDEVRTAHGVFGGKFTVDASGWRAALGRQVKPDLVSSGQLNFGIETTVVHEDDGLHFWFDPQRLLPMGVTWAFPSGGENRLGMGSYRGDSRLGGSLDRFVTELGARRHGTHGGYFPHAMRPPVLGNLFLVGDAAGQCLALTGEGIRPALFFGTHLGRTLRRALDGGISVTDARTHYAQLVEQYRPGFDALSVAQKVLPRLPVPVLETVLAVVSLPRVLRPVLSLYLQSFGLEPAQPTAVAAGATSSSRTGSHWQADRPSSRMGHERRRDRATLRQHPRGRGLRVEKELRQ